MGHEPRRLGGRLVRTMTTMTLGIRELSAPAIARAAEHRQLIHITNGGVLAGVLVPVSNSEVQQLVDQNLTRVIHNINRGEREIQKLMEGTAVDGPGTSANVPSLGSPAPRFVTADDVLQEESAPVLDLTRMRRVPLREVSGRLLQEAAERNEAVAVTTDRVVAGVIFPVTQQWVSQLIEQNLSRVLFSIQSGEAELASSQRMTTADDVADS